MVGTFGGGTEKKVARFGCSVTFAIARASHLLLLAIFYPFEFRFLFGRLCFALCLIVSVKVLLCL